MKDPYVYEDTGTLINKLGIKDYEELRQAESDITFSKLITVERDVKFSEFNLEYLKDIHKYILGDIFDWAGEFRIVPMEKPEVILGGDTIRYAYPTEIKSKAVNSPFIGYELYGFCKYCFVDGKLVYGGE